jgi:hypothetical protein
MEKKKLFRDRQEFGPDDLDDMQEGIRDSFDHIVADALTVERRFVGFQVAKENATAIRVGIGRLYQAGKVYPAADESVISVTSSLPVVNRKILAVYIFGQSTDTDVEDRTFVTDTAVYPPTGVPTAVPMTNIRFAQVGTTVGLESVDPQMPAMPDNACLIATVILTTTGVLDGGITRYIANVLPNLQDHHGRLAGLDVFVTSTGAKVDALTSEQAALNVRTLNKADQIVVTGMMTDLARVKRILNLPSNNAPYDTDLFEDSSQIDQTASPVTTNYLISPFGGADFPHAAEAIAPLGLFNPYEASVYRSGTDFVLPKFTPVLAVQVPGYSGEVSMSQITTTTVETKLMVGTKTETRYGYA